MSVLGLSRPQISSGASSLICISASTSQPLRDDSAGPSLQVSKRIQSNSKISLLGQAVTCGMIHRFLKNMSEVQELTLRFLQHVVI
jgi:hypothetical protein